MTVWIEAPFDSMPPEGYRKQRYWLMAEAFVAAGHEVVYWTSDFSHATKRRRVFVNGGAHVECLGELAIMRCAGFDLALLKTRPYPKNVCLARIRSHREYAREWERQTEALARARSRPDVIVISVPPVATGAAAIRLARKFGARLVVDVQDAWPETFRRLLPFGFGWLGGVLLHGMAAAVRRTYRAADLVTGVCDRYEALVKGYGAREYYRAYLGIECERDAAGARAERTDDAVRLVYVGNLGKSYDLATVVEGVRRMNARGGRRVTLDVAGFGGAVERDEAVRFHGMLGRDDLRRLLAECDVGVIPMRADSFVGIPNKLGEYAAAGLRVVSSLEGETARLIAEYGCGATYRPGDVGDFVAAVASARALPRTASAALVERELAADRIYRDYARRIESLVSRGKLP